ncbi:MAG: hypothetical protein PVI79_14450 [Gammaproteobacteria bacterium]|jgi:hypothetical protein
MPDREAFQEAYIRPFRLVEQLDLKCGYEKSFKLIERRLLRNRYLLGIEKSILDDSKLASICEQMKLPEKFAERFFDDIAEANLVLLGFEEGADYCSYRIYFEYWDRLRRRISASPPPYQPMTLFQGYKWSTNDGDVAVVTDYVCYPRLGTDEIVARIREIGADGEAFAIAIEIISLAARLAGDQAFVYLEASEGGNPRNSFDINLYPAGMTLQSIYPRVERLFEHYGIPATELERLYRDCASRPLGHLSAGIDREGRDFFTVYYENQPGE